MSTQSSLNTKEALLTTGRKLFGTFGFDGVSLRRLTQEAGVNLAMVNYHFGSKFALYETIIDQVISKREQAFRSPESVQQALDSAGNSPRELSKVVAWHVEYMVHGLLSSPSNLWTSQLIEREQANPTACYRKLEEQLFAPNRKSIRLLVEAALGDTVSQDEVTIMTHSILGIFIRFLEDYKHIAKDLGSEYYTKLNIDRIAEALSKRILLMLELPPLQ